jgi:hypothetical protein
MIHQSLSPLPGDASEKSKPGLSLLMERAAELAFPWRGEEDLRKGVFYGGMEGFSDIITDVRHGVEIMHISRKGCGPDSQSGPDINRYRLRS